jgi:hypothetical protein
MLPQAVEHRLGRGQRVVYARTLRVKPTMCDAFEQLRLRLFTEAIEFGDNDKFEIIAGGVLKIPGGKRLRCPR